MRNRFSRSLESLNARSRYLLPLAVGDQVFIQNQRGPNGNKWDKSGTVVGIRPFDQYVLKVDGSGRLTLRNRKFLRKFVPPTMSISYPAHKLSTIDQQLHKSQPAEINLQPPNLPSTSETHINKPMVITSVNESIAISGTSAETEKLTSSQQHSVPAEVTIHHSLLYHPPYRCQMIIQKQTLLKRQLHGVARVVNCILANISPKLVNGNQYNVQRLLNTLRTWGDVELCLLTIMYIGYNCSHYY